MTLREFQALIRGMYHDKDASRGIEGTFMWLTEEIGELVLFMCSDACEFMTADTVYVNGGGGWR